MEHYTLRVLARYKRLIKNYIKRSGFNPIHNSLPFEVQRKVRLMYDNRVDKLPIRIKDFHEVEKEFLKQLIHVEDGLNSPYLRPLEGKPFKKPSLRKTLNNKSFFSMKNFLIIIVLSYIIFSIFTASKYKDLQKVNDYLIDSLKIERNELSQEIAKRKNLEVENEKQLLEIKTKDSTVIKLQKEVKKYKGKAQAAVVIKNKTVIKEKLKTKVVRDSINKKDVYIAKINKPFLNGQIIAKFDSIYLDIEALNKYTIIIGKKSNGWFKKRTSEIVFKSENPDTKTLDLRSVIIRHKPKRFSLGIFVGYDYRLRPTFGIGLTYNILNIK